MSDELTRTLLLEEVASRRRIADALYASVKGGVPLLAALVDAGAATSEVLGRYLARTDVPFLRQVAPVLELVDRLPPGLCARLLALPVRQDAITGTVDVCVAHPADPHTANELAFHLGAPVRVVRASVVAIEEALYRLRLRADGPVERFREAAAHATRELAGVANEEEQHERMWDSRPRASEPPPTTLRDPRPRLDSFDDVRDRLPSLPAVEPELLAAISFATPLAERAARRSLVIEPGSSLPPAPPHPAPPPGALPQSVRMKTPAWGTPIHRGTAAGSDPPSSYGSEIPIPLTRKTMGPQAMLMSPVQPAQPTQPNAGGTRRPPSLADQLGEGYAFDGTGLRDIIERPFAPRIDATRLGDWARPLIGNATTPSEAPPRSFIPGPAPGMSSAPRMPFPEMGGILAALRNAGSRDEVLELCLTASRMVAGKVALFVVKKGGYQGWVGSPELGGRAVLQSVLVPLEAASIFDRAVREDIYLGPVRNDEVHAPALPTPPEPLARRRGGADPRERKDRRDHPRRRARRHDDRDASPRGAREGRGRGVRPHRARASALTGRRRLAVAVAVRGEVGFVRDRLLTGVDGEHGHISASDHLLRDAADERVRDAGPPVRPHHDEVRANLRRRLVDAVHRIALLDERADHHAARRAGRELTVEADLRALEDLRSEVTRGGDHAVGEAERRYLVRVEQHQLRAERLRQVDRVIERSLRRIAEVGGNEDGLR